MREVHSGSPDADVSEAAMFASYYHRNDRRGPRGPLANDPYIAHPYRVALRLLRWGCTQPDLIKAALLHDVYEDHADDIARDHPGMSAIRALTVTFGVRVADLVFALSNPPGCTPEQYVTNVTTKVSASPDVLLIKFSDFGDNALSLHHTPGHRRGRLARKYLPLVNVFDTALEKHSETLWIDYGVPVGDLQDWLHKGAVRLVAHAQEP